MAVALDEERKARLQAFLAGEEETPAGEPPAPLLTDERKARLTEFMPKGEPPKAPPTAGEIARGVAGSVGTGLVEIADMPYFIKQAGGALADAVEPYLPKALTELTDKLPEQSGIPTINPAMALLQRYGIEGLKRMGIDASGILTGDRPVSDLPGLRQSKEYFQSLKVPEGESTTADVLQTGAEFTGGGLPGALKTGLKKGLPMAAEYLAKDTATGVVAGAAREAAEAVDPAFGPWAEIVAGVTAGGALNRPQPQQVGELEENFRLIRDVADDPDAALENLRAAVARGETGSLSDLTGDPNIARLEKLAQSENPNLAVKLEELNAARDAATLKYIMRPVETGVPTSGARQVAQAEVDTAVDAAQRQADEAAKAIDTTTQRGIADLNAPIDEARRQQRLADMELEQTASQRRSALARATEAQRQAEQATAGVTPRADAATISTEASGLYGDLAKAARKKVDAAYDAYRDGPDFDATKLKAISSATVANLTPQEKKLLGNNTKLIQEGAEFDVNMSPKEYDAYLKRIEASIQSNTDATGKMNPAGARMLDYKKALEEQYLESNPLYADAKAAESAWQQKYNVEGLRGTAAKAPEELFLQDLTNISEGGAVTARVVNALEEPAMQDLLLERLKYTSRGKIDDEWLIKNEQLLSRLPPEKVDAFYAANQAQKGAESALTRSREALDAEAAARAQSGKAREGVVGAEATAAEKKVALEQARAQQLEQVAEQQTRLTNAAGETLLGKYAKDPAFTLTNVLKQGSQEQKVAELTDLWKRMDEAGQGDSFKSQVAETLSKMLTDGRRGTNIKSEQYGPFLDNLSALRRAGAIDDAQVRQMTAEANRGLDIIQQRQRARKFVEERNPGEVKNLVSSAFAAYIGTMLSGAQALMMGAAIKRNVLALMNKNKLTPEQLRSMEVLFIDPGQYISAAEGAKTAEEAARGMISLALGVNVAEALAEGTGGI